LQYINQANYLYNEIATTFNQFTRSAVYGVYTNSANLTRQFLENLENEKQFLPDMKTINRLIKNMNQEFTVVVEGGKEYIKSFITFSKQGRITESQIDNAILKGYIQKGTAKGAKKVLFKEFDEAMSKELYDRVNNDTGFFRKIKYEQIENMSVSDAAKMRLKKDFEEKLANQQYLPLINKNGDVMVFKTETYSNLVARTRLGEAQTAATIDAGQANGVNYYRVTSHNTETLECKVHEGKIYAVKKGDPKFAALSDYTKYKDEKGRTKESQNKPLYHINCRHRLIPFAMTTKRYESYPDRKMD
jgi:hypothetical protein